MPIYRAPRIADVFVEIADPRVEYTKLHRLLDILTPTLSGVHCRPKNWIEIVD